VLVKTRSGYVPRTWRRHRSPAPADNRL